MKTIKFKIGKKRQHDSDLKYKIAEPGDKIPPSAYQQSSLDEKILSYISNCYRNLPQSFDEPFIPETPIQAAAYTALTHLKRSLEYYRNGDIENSFNSFANAFPILDQIPLLQREDKVKAGASRTGEATKQRQDQHKATIYEANNEYERLRDEGKTKSNCYAIIARQFGVKPDTVKKWGLGKDK